MGDLSYWNLDASLIIFHFFLLFFPCQKYETFTFDSHRFDRVQLCGEFRRYCWRFAEKSESCDGAAYHVSSSQASYSLSPMPKGKYKIHLAAVENAVMVRKKHTALSQRATAEILAAASRHPWKKSPWDNGAYDFLWLIKRVTIHPPMFSPKLYTTFIQHLNVQLSVSYSYC